MNGLCLWLLSDLSPERESLPFALHQRRDRRVLMSTLVEQASRPEYNVTGVDFPEGTISVTLVRR